MRRINGVSKASVLVLLCGATALGACDSPTQESVPTQKSVPAAASSVEDAKTDDTVTVAVAEKDNRKSGSVVDSFASANDAPAEGYGAEPAPEPEFEASGEAEEIPMPSSLAPVVRAESKKSIGLSRRGKGGGIPGVTSGKQRARRRPMSKDKWAEAPPPPPKAKPTTGEEYDVVQENDFIAVADDPRSTFSIDVDTASYSNIRRYLEGGSMPPPEAVRVEEMINYFSYNYESPIGTGPFSINTEVSGTPWNEDSLLVSVGLQGQRIDMSEVGARNLVFLLDVSGSMNDPDKLPLLKQGLGMLVNNLRNNDRVSIVVYAGASGVVLQPTMGSDKPRIMEALQRLEAGGSTNGGDGIKLAYSMAAKNFEKGGVNRVILATDGDFNVGVTNRTELVELIEEKRKSGVFLSVLGFGTGNMQDSTMEMLADKGNGNYAYIDNKAEARKVLVEEAGGTLVTIAKDVKIQVEFNPAEVESYRLIGYENRKLAHADFNDDTKDAGEIGAGHSVTALYEVTPKGSKTKSTTDKLKYQDEKEPTAAAKSGELLTVKVRYKKPDGKKSKLISLPVSGDDRGIRNTTKDYRFAAAVAQFGMILRHSKHKGTASYDDVLKLAGESLGSDTHGHRKAFLALVKKAKSIQK